ncbi:MAG TPA: rubredoxin [Rhabdaerophilum sp.]|nr:rubredoxin [Rhabdaerophilum sp.]
MRPPGGNQIGEPVAFLAESSPHRVQETHFHIVEQFQVVMSGGGTIGRHPLRIHDVHYSRAFTPYAIIADEKGCGFLTLRPDYDTGAQTFPQAREKLVSVPNRDPWQVTEHPVFKDAPDGVFVHEFENIRDDKGLAAFSIRLAPGASATAHDPRNGRGQFIVVTRGSIVHEGKQYSNTTIGWVEPHEAAFRLTAGPEGADVLVLNHPRVTGAGYIGTVHARGNPVSNECWGCKMCGYVYDEAEGIELDGIKAGTSFAQLPDDWTCPECIAPKSDFRRVQRP